MPSVNTSKKIANQIKKYRKRGYKIKETTDSYFLRRNPNGRKDMKRVGKRLGTGWAGTGVTIFAYKDLKRKSRR